MRVDIYLSEADLSLAVFEHIRDEKPGLVAALDITQDDIRETMGFGASEDRRIQVVINR